MAVRHELVYDERGGFAAADKLTPKKKTTQKNRKKEAQRNEIVFTKKPTVKMHLAL